MSVSPICPMCHGSDTQVTDHVSVQTLIAGYGRDALAVDVAALFAGAGGAAGNITLNHCGSCDLKWYSPQVAGDGPFYVALQKHAWYYQPDKPEYSFACTHVPEGARVLEVGCGRGAFREFLPARLTYRGLEFNTGAVQMARERGLDVQIRAIENEAQAAPASCDVVCHFQVLEHVSDPAGFMQACAAALRPGGTFIVAVPAEDSFVGLAESAWLNMPPHHLTRWSDRALANALAAVGVEMQAVWHEPVADIHRNWHEAVLTNAGLRAVLHQAPPRLVSGGALTDLARRLHHRAKPVAAWLQRRALQTYPGANRGHTVCMVGRKKA